MLQLQDGRSKTSAFALRYNATGSLLWERQWGTNESDAAAGAAADLTDHLLYVVGSTAGAMSAVALAPNATVSCACTLRLCSSQTDECFSVSTVCTATAQKVLQASNKLGV
jgi:hypothetical protein